MIIFNVSNKFLQTNMSLSRDVRFFLKAQNLKLELTARTRKSEPFAMLVVFRVQVSGHTWPPGSRVISRFSFISTTLTARAFSVSRGTWNRTNEASPS